ncbi:zona pellucida sperm-binding protein 3-like isoform X2 [Alosa sapidissima]|uniref:zona pellucida sperm-binding protein 3-like isoform X2 n=1 Tax=Alosa sapidissima TaxID=34773 RepID=UPI001C0A65A2|nr:zona pellucida sperm-binding protein 3-like isoform X2 [Alosa sapidissima]
MAHIFTMGFSAPFVFAMVLYVISLQVEAKQLPWLYHEGGDPSGVSDRSSVYKPLGEGHTGDSFGSSWSQRLRNSAQEPVGKVFRKPAQEPALSQSKQTLQEPKKQPSWKYPWMPEKPTSPEVPVVPVPADSVAVRCGENNILVEVNQDFFGTGQLIEPGDIRLGDCFMTSDDISSRVLVFDSELHRCGSRLQMIEDELVYTFTLVYAPQALGPSPIVRTNSATVDIICRYSRVHNVSSDALRPTWVPYAATKVAEEGLTFSLRLMTDDWKFVRAPNTYYLGDTMHIEASVIQYNHVPLRVFVHSCVATAVPDMNALPKYSFIENHGCLVDAKLTGSRSRFLPRAQDDKLRFELEAFRFAPGDGDNIYIACQLVATTASTMSNHKACSFSNDRWTCSDGMDEMCVCCDSTCGTEGAADGLWESEALLGPIKVIDAY